MQELEEPTLQARNVKGWSHTPEQDPLLSQLQLYQALHNQ